MLVLDSTEYREGVVAFLGDDPRSENPYPLNSLKGEDWARGWDDANHDTIDENAKNSVS